MPQDFTCKLNLLYLGHVWLDGLTLSVHKNKRSNSEITYFKLKYLGAKAWPSAYRFTSIRFLLTGIVAITQGCKGTLLNLSFDYYCRICYMFVS